MVYYVFEDKLTYLKESMNSILSHANARLWWNNQPLFDILKKKPKPQIRDCVSIGGKLEVRRRWLHFPLSIQVLTQLGDYNAFAQGSRYYSWCRCLTIQGSFSVVINVHDFGSYPNVHVANIGLYKATHIYGRLFYIFVIKIHWNHRYGFSLFRHEFFLCIFLFAAR